MSRRSLVFVLGLTVGDYLLWNWSLNGNHDVLALISGLTLPPLALVSFWLLAVTVARVLGMLTRRPTVGAGPSHRKPNRTTGSQAGRSSAGAQRAASAADRPSRKIAA